MPRVRRTRSPHPGLVLVRRKLKGGTVIGVRAKWRDPDTNQVVWFTLDPLAMPNDKARIAWAKAKSESLARRRAELASGAPRRTETAMQHAIDAFVDGPESRLRDSTRARYRAVLDDWMAWARRRGVVNVEDVTPAVLTSFRGALVARRRKNIVRHGRRGERVETTAARSPWTVNGDLAAFQSFLNDQRKRERTPKLTRDAISEQLAELTTPKELPNPLRPHECVQLLGAALAHDRATYKITRAEHRLFPSATNVGATRRYTQVAPFVLCLLLTGMRFNEARNLKWIDVDLDAVNERAEPVGEIRLRAAETKTFAMRRIDLGVCPAVRSVLQRLRTAGAEGPYVFGGESPLSEHALEAARLRMTKPPYGAPSFSWQRLRKTCGSYLTNAPGIFGAASAFRSAAQLGHSVQVAQRHYVGVLRGLPSHAHTVEDAMGIAAIAAEVVQDRASAQRREAVS